MTEQRLQEMQAEYVSMAREYLATWEEYQTLLARAAAHASMLVAYGYPIPETVPKIIMAKSESSVASRPNGD